MVDTGKTKKLRKPLINHLNKQNYMEKEIKVKIDGFWFGYLTGMICSMAIVIYHNIAH